MLLFTRAAASIYKCPFRETRLYSSLDEAVVIRNTPDKFDLHPSIGIATTCARLQQRSLTNSQCFVKSIEWISQREDAAQSMDIANGAGGSNENGHPYDLTNGAGGPGHKRSLSGSLLSKLSFLRASADSNQVQADPSPTNESADVDEPTSPKKSGRALAAVVQQQKTRRRKGSLRKAALLGRGAQRERKEGSLSIARSDYHGFGGDGPISPTSPLRSNGLGLSILDTTLSDHVFKPVAFQPATASDDTTNAALNSSPTSAYTSTTDEEDVLSIPKHLPALRTNTELPHSSGSDSYFPSRTSSGSRRRSAQHKPPSPLSHVGGGPPGASALPVPNSDWDYSETEWWGWVILFLTWIVFVVGMGSCLGVWSWAWDVGETPYAPPELEDDPTLPIVGYYPALIILTGVMAWVWVVVAWVGMKYFRHAKISGD